MPKHQDEKPHPKEKPHEKKPPKKDKPTGVGASLIGKQEAVIKRFIPDDRKRESISNHLENEGPAHKQVYSALLLARATALIDAVEAKTRSKFEVQKGTTLISGKEEIEIPVPVPAASITGGKRAEVIEALSHSPAHEIALFNTLLQSIEWSIKAIG